MTPDFTFQAPGLKIEAWRSASSEELPFAGVLVEFGDGILPDTRLLALESALRYWQREVGAVRRGARADLSGWRIYVAEQGRVARLRLTYQEEKTHAEADG